MDFEFQVNMLGEYKKLTVESGISDLPMTINYNNDVTKKEFENIYDSSTGYLKRSLVAPKGKVDVHEGRFINLRVSNLIIEKSKVDGNETELKDSHTDLKDRFSWDSSVLPTVTVSNIDRFAHDTKNIVSWADSSNPIDVGDMSFSSPVTLRDELDAIESCLMGVAKNISFKESDGTDDVSEELKDIIEGESDSADINTKTPMIYGSSLDDARYEEIMERIKRIEKRLTKIEFRLDTEKN